MAPRTDTSSPVSSANGDSSPAEPAAASTNDNDAEEEQLIMGYTHAQCVAALRSIEGPSSDVTCRHIFGHGNPDHRLSMLQKVTAVRILDYEKSKVSVTMYINIYG